MFKNGGHASGSDSEASAEVQALQVWTGDDQLKKAKKGRVKRMATRQNIWKKSEDVTIKNWGMHRNGAYPEQKLVSNLGILERKGAER